MAFRAGRYLSLIGEGSYLWVSSLKLLPLEKVAEGKVRHGCAGGLRFAVELCLLCSLGEVVVTKGSALTELRGQERPRGKFPWSNTNAKPLFPFPHP